MTPRESRGRRLAAAALALLAVTATAAAPAAAGPLDTAFGDETPPIVEYGDGTPSWLVKYDADSFGSLQDWADASDDRTIHRHHNATRLATVEAPRAAVNGDLLERVQAAIDTDDENTGLLPDLPSVDLALLSGDSLLSRAGYVDYIEPNYRVERPEPVTPLDGADDWRPPVGLSAIDDPAYPTAGVAFDEHANRTYMNTSRRALGVDNVTRADGTGITVAVCDTGANTADGRVFGNGTANSSLRIDNASKSFISDSSVNASAGNYSAIEDTNGHGTWVASALAANASGTVHDGIAPNATLLVLQCLAGDGSGSISDIAAGVRYAADHGADVISMSLGSPVYSRALADSIHYAFNESVSAVVVAAGNSRQTTTWVASPADVDGVIAVGATNATEPARAGSAYFSQVGPDSGATDASGGTTRGETITVSAPGMQTVARTPTLASGGARNTSLSGTSMATPMVAGVVALALDANPEWRGDHETVHEWLRKTARPTPNIASAETGHGMAAADNLIQRRRPGESQEAAMTTAARERQVFYESLSGGAGLSLPFAAAGAAGVEASESGG